MAIQVSPIEGGNGVGCEVRGLTYDDLSNPAVREQLVSTWTEHGMIVFRGLEGAEFQIELSKVFGDVQPHPHADQNPERAVSDLVQLSYDPENADIYEINGKVLGGWLPWHQDLIYSDKVSRGSILRPVVLPYEGGQTGFMDKIQLHKKLSPEMQKRIEGLDVVYHFDMDFNNLKYGRPASIKVVSLSRLYSKLISERDNYPRVLHPLVYRQKETGRPVLNFSPYFAQNVAEVSPEESDEILTAIGKLCEDPANCYFHEWQPGDMVLWDNWRMLHAAAGVPTDASRVMERSQIMGDYGFGRLENSSDRVSEKMRTTV